MYTKNCEWFPLPIKVVDYPEPARSIFMNKIDMMLSELDSERLRVVLTDGGLPNGRKLRSKISSNPEWYSLLAQRRSYRRPNPCKNKNSQNYPPNFNFKRSEVVGALQRIKNGKEVAGIDKKASLVWDLKQIIFEDLTMGGDHPEFGAYPPVLEVDPPRIPIVTEIVHHFSAKDYWPLFVEVDPKHGLADPYKLKKFLPKSKVSKPIPGIYFLFKKEKLVYIGKSTQIRWRIYDHIKGRECKPYISKYDGRPRNERIIKPKDFTKAACIYLPTRLANVIEPWYIARYRPELNQVGVDRNSDHLDFFGEIL